MNSTLILSEKEKGVHTFSEADLNDPTQVPKFFLVAKCLSNSINPNTFIKRMGAFWSNKCRFDVTISEMHSELFLLSICCAGDLHRILNGEPWHFNNQLVLLHSPSVLSNVTKSDLTKAQFWVQTHRLPFLSKSRALAQKVGEWMIGDKLPTSSYDRYRIDFSKANIYPFLTRITKKAIGHAIPAINSNRNLAIGSLPYTSPLTLVESSFHTTSVSESVETIPEIPSPFPTYYQTISHPFNTFSPTANAYPGSPSYVNHSPVTTLTHSTTTHSTTEAIYTSSMIIASEASFSQTKGPATLFPTNKGKVVAIHDDLCDSEAANRTFKRHVDPENFRSVLKRWRNNSLLGSIFDGDHSQSISGSSLDSIENLPSLPAAVVNKQPDSQP
uniref:DUF4283 domain-containing protein n=1 Tax=Cannabis sativa TaxID=3483 RepID=A0A803PZ88_CANSA